MSGFSNKLLEPNQSEFLSAFVLLKHEERLLLKKLLMNKSAFSPKAEFLVSRQPSLRISRPIESDYSYENL